MSGGVDGHTATQGQSQLCTLAADGSGISRPRAPKAIARSKPVSSPAHSPNIVERPLWWTSDEWRTPPEVFTPLAAEFGPFDLDPCCRTESALAPKFYTPTENGLLREWNGRVWLNPPYSNPAPWLRRAIDAAQHGALIVALLPASTCTAWFHDLVLPLAEVRFLRGRVRFIGWAGTPIDRPKSPSIVAIYRPQTA
jgi:phage N-6-adenine-methyltransferase